MNRRNAINETTRWPFWAFVVVVVCFVYQEFVGVVNRDNIEDNLHLWLKKNSLSYVVEMLGRNGMVKCILMFQCLDSGFSLERQ